MTYRNKEDIKKELIINLAHHKAAVKAWQAVTFNVKKDGKPFKTLSKNFNNARYYTKEYGFHSTVLEVMFNTEYQNYICDEIDCAPCVKYYDNKNIEPSRIIKEHFLEDYFYLNLEEIKKEINKNIEMHKNYILSYEKQLHNLDKSFNEIDKYIKLINDNLKKYDDEKNYHNTLTYALRDYLKDNLR